MIRIKTCCIGSIGEAKTAIEFGASANGLVGTMASGQGVIDDEMIRKIAKTAPPPVAIFLLTGETSSGGIIAHHRKVNTNTIQIVDKLTMGSFKDIGEKSPGLNSCRSFIF